MIISGPCDDDEVVITETETNEKHVVWFRFQVSERPTAI